MNILYIAYSCSPYHGSEDKIGWNVPVESAKTNRVFVITKEEQRKYVKDYLCKNPLKNISFYYVDIPKVYKRLFTGSFYSGRLNIWNRWAYETAKNICEKESIDIIHQITPVEFRSIGNYGKIPGIKFVCGPIAGGQKIPRALYGYLSPSQKCTEHIRSAVNGIALALLKTSGKLSHCDYLYFANSETERYLKPCMSLSLKSERMLDISIATHDLCVEKDLHKKCERETRFLVVGRLVYLKGYNLLLDALNHLQHGLNYSCTVIGEGKEKDALVRKSVEMGLENHVRFLGAVPYEQIRNYYDAADVLIFPSFREASGSVILEAMARGVPVIAMNKFGAAMIMDEETGWLYDAASQKVARDGLRDAASECILKQEEITRKGRNARKRAGKDTWDSKMRRFQSMYEKILGHEQEQ